MVDNGSELIKMMTVTSSVPQDNNFELIPFTMFINYLSEYLGHNCSLAILKCVKHFVTTHNICMKTVSVNQNFGILKFAFTLTLEYVSLV